MSIVTDISYTWLTIQIEFFSVTIIAIYKALSVMILNP